MNEVTEWGAPPPADSFAASGMQSPAGGSVNPEHFYRYENLPLRLDPERRPLIARDAPPHEDLQLIHEPRTRRFRLWFPAELEEYHQIMRYIGISWFILREEHVQYVPAEQNWVILLSWIERYWEPPKNAPIVATGQRVHENGYTTQTYR